jgi:Ca-activated chloride channel family protein
MNLDDFHFLRPWWFLALPFLTLLWLRLRQTATRSSWEAICDPHLLPFIISGKPGRRERFSSRAVAGAIILCIVALAGPTWQRLPQPVFRQQSALVILLDLSRSMDCPDITPTRLTRARYKVADILRKRSEGQTALVVFAGTAFTVTPLTTDTNTIAALLNSLHTEIMPSQGSRVDLAIEKGLQLIEQAGLQRGDLVLIGDGIEGQRSLIAAKNLSGQGHRLSVLGVGTPEGAPIATSGSFLQDAQGAIVIPKLAEDLLRDLAKAGAGVYQQLSIDDRDIDTLLATDELNLRQNAMQKTDLFTDRWQDLGPWLLLPLLPLAAFGFRRGYLVILLLCWLIPVAPAQAMELTDLWSRPDQQASRDLQQGHAAEAAEKFTNPAWRAVANYRAGQFQQSIDALAGLTDSTSLYNKGNDLAQLGRYPEAIKAYEEALTADPEHADAKYNRDLLLERQQKDEPPAPPQDQNNSAPEPSKDDAHSGDQQSSAGQQNDSKSSDPGPADQQNQTDPSAGQQAATEAAEQATDDKAVPQTPLPEQQNGVPQPNQETTGDSLAAADKDNDAKPSTEQWLQQIPDDPGSLLQRKFFYQYQQQQQKSNEENPW